MNVEIKDAMSVEARTAECLEMIQMALKTYGCKFDVVAILKENGTDFNISVVPEGV